MVKVAIIWVSLVGCPGFELWIEHFWVNFFFLLLACKMSGTALVGSRGQLLYFSNYVLFSYFVKSLKKNLKIETFDLVCRDLLFFLFVH